MYMYVAFHTVLGEYDSGDHSIFTGVLATLHTYMYLKYNVHIQGVGGAKLAYA